MEERYHLMKNLRRIRGFLQLSQAEFSKEVGISKSTLQEIEKGNGATLDTLMCIADYMNISVAALLSDPEKIENTLLAVQFLERGVLYTRLPMENRKSFLRETREILDALEDAWLRADSAPPDIPGGKQTAD